MKPVVKAGGFIVAEHLQMTLEADVADACSP